MTFPIYARASQDNCTFYGDFISYTKIRIREKDTPIISGPVKHSPLASPFFTSNNRCRAVNSAFHMMPTNLEKDAWSPAPHKLSQVFGGREIDRNWTGTSAQTARRGFRASFNQAAWHGLSITFGIFCKLTYLARKLINPKPQVFVTKRREININIIGGGRKDLNNVVTCGGWYLNYFWSSEELCWRPNVPSLVCLQIDEKSLSKTPRCRVCLHFSQHC